MMDRDRLSADRKDSDNRGGQSQLVLDSRIKTRKPSMYKVLMMNDDYTPMEFVVHVLQHFFNLSNSQANAIMLNVHRRGIGVCGIYSYEVAEAKATKVMEYARQNEHPLQLQLEIGIGTMLSRELEETLRRAMGTATAKAHEFATLEHLLLALTEDSDALEVLSACKVDIQELRSRLTHYIETELASIVSHSENLDVQPTASFQRVIQRAIIHTQSSGREVATGANVLVSIFSERESHAVWFLKSLNMTRLDAVSYISHGSDGNVGRGADEQVETDAETAEGSDPLSQYAVDLIAKASAGRIDPLIGRDRELDRTIQVLCRRTKNNPLYVGDPGVGKTAIAEGWRFVSTTAKCRMFSATR